MSEKGDKKGQLVKPWQTHLYPLGKPLSSRHGLIKLVSSFNVVAVGLLSKLLVKLNNFTIVNHETFLKVAENHFSRQHHRPLLTIANHSSCIDDPTLWGALLPWSWHINSSRHRWSSAADDICFTKLWHTWFFALGQTFPIERGKGIYQPAMDFAIQLLKERRFLHCFPQGKVVDEPDINDVELVHSDDHNLLTLIDRKDQEEKPYAFKWGLARLIIDALENENSANQVELLPFYHIGMHDVLPNAKPYIPRLMKKVTVYIRKDGPIIFDHELISWILKQPKFNCGKDLEGKRIAICRYLEDEVKKLKLEAMKIHWKVK